MTTQSAQRPATEEPRAGKWSLGEGQTPLLDLSPQLADLLGVAAVFVKCEHLNPTGSFKDRFAARAAQLAVSGGYRGLIGISSGNAGASCAAYAAHAGLPAITVTRPDAPAAKVAQIRALGGRTIPVQRSFDPSQGALASTIEAVSAVADEHNLFIATPSFTHSPDAMAGLDSVSAELDIEVPSASLLYCPVGGGGLLTGLARGYRGRSSKPRLVGCQPRLNPTLRAALGETVTRPQEMSAISGLQIEVLFDEDTAVTAIRNSGGHVSSPTDEQTHHAQSLLSTRCGILVEPAGAISLAAAFVDSKAGVLRSDDVVVLALSGAGWKDQQSLQRLGMDTTTQSPSIPLTELSVAVAASLE